MREVIDQNGIRTLTVKDGLLELTKEELDYNKGNHIWICVKGFEGNPDDNPEYPTQVMIEDYEDRLRVHVWDGNDENPAVFGIAQSEYGKVAEAKKEDLPLMIHDIKDEDALELLENRLKGEK